MNVRFLKMHGAGNDFLVIDDRSLCFPAGDADWMARLCVRRRGVGGEGVILLQPSRCAHVRMRFFNPDGREADLCGNGLRCAARFAFDRGFAPETARIETGAGILETQILADGVRVGMPAPRRVRIEQVLETGDRDVRYGFVDTGVPHVVIEVDALASADVDGLGRAVRRHADFAPAGANVNFVQVGGPHALSIRTYERGVEGESGACGTGIAAAALILSIQGRVSPPVRVSTTGGDILTVDFCTPDGRPEGVTLTGPVTTVFSGEVEYGSPP